LIRETFLGVANSYTLQLSCAEKARSSEQFLWYAYLALNLQILSTGEEQIKSPDVTRRAPGLKHIRKRKQPFNVGTNIYNLFYSTVRTVSFIYVTWVYLLIMLPQGKLPHGNMAKKFY
jgi:hypothetical protein